MVMRELLVVGEVAIAGIEALRQEKEAADAVAHGVKVAGMLELILVAIGMVGPDVLNLIALLSSGHVFHIA